jgi:hypothetical protein
MEWLAIDMGRLAAESHLNSAQFVQQSFNDSQRLRYCSLSESIHRQDGRGTEKWTMSQGPFATQGSAWIKQGQTDGNQCRAVIKRLPLFSEVGYKDITMVTSIAAYCHFTNPYKLLTTLFHAKITSSR